MKLALYLDDVRNPPATGQPWVVARTFETAQRILQDNWDRISYVSFDHDLGPDTRSGYDLITWIEQEIREQGRSNHFTMEVHSANPVGVARIRAVITSLYAQ